MIWNFYLYIIFNSFLSFLLPLVLSFKKKFIYKKLYFTEIHQKDIGSGFYVFEFFIQTLTSTLLSNI